MRWTAGLALFVVLTIVGAPRPATAQERVLAQIDPGGWLTGVTLLVPSGSAMDPAGSEGTALVLGRLLELEGNAQLSSRGARLEVEVRRDDMALTLLAPPEEWVDALDELRALLFGGGPLPEARASSLLEQQRDRAIFEEGAPVRDFEVERARLLLGAASPGARSRDGTRSSIATIDAESLRRFRDAHFDPARVRIAVAGPATELQLRQAFPGGFEEVRPTAPFVRSTPLTPRPRPDTAAALPGDADLSPELRPGPLLRLRSVLEPPVPGSGPRAWDTGRRDVIDRELTSTWMSVIWPFPAGTSEILLGFLGHLAAQAVVTTPPDPGLFRIEFALDEHEGAPVLVVSASVDPRTTRAWEAKITGVIEALAASPPEGAFFELGRRRYRSARLLATAAPGDRSRWLARTAHAGRSVPDEELEIWALTREAVSRGATAAGEPRVLLMGPRAMFEDPGS